MRSSRSSGKIDGKVRKRVRPGSSRDSALRTEPTQSQSLKSPMTMVGRGALPGDREQLLGLLAPLVHAQAQMRRDHAQRPVRRRRSASRWRGAARAPDRRGRGSRSSDHRPAADQHLAVFAVVGGDRLRADAVLAELALQKIERIDAASSRRESTSCSATICGSQRSISSTTRARSKRGLRPNAPWMFQVSTRTVALKTVFRISRTRPARRRRARSRSRRRRRAARRRPRSAR